ncbi:hypothetical protein DMUE_6143 [Dictyocoela muelleri]|nr:hypothetical protein DMUE_6143 [Dictyocoela muelleri]
MLLFTSKKKNNNVILHNFYNQIVDRINEMLTIGHTINFEILKNIANDIKKEDQDIFSCFNISNYFIRKFLTEMNIKYANLHGGMLSPDKNAIPFYLERFNV